jgi:hypothetical protein
MKNNQRKIPNVVMALAQKQARVVAERHAIPQPEEEREPEIRTRRQLVREKIVTGLRKLHPMD